MLDRRAFTAAAAAGLLSSRVAWGAQDAVASSLKVLTDSPRNAEPPLEALIQSWRTPNELFYIRSHAPAPKLDVTTFQLSVEGMVRKPFTITLAELQGRFAKQSVVATMTCAGNRRKEHSAVEPVGGVPWGSGAIGNAQWGGARLSDLLKRAGVLESAKHVWFEGVDQIQRSDGVIPFGASIPLKKAFADTRTMPGALVAYEMNERPLPLDHGFPMRTVVPGFIGARSVKWLGKIIVSDRPSSNHYVAKAYKLVTEGTTEEWKEAPPLYSFAINSVICTPSAGANVLAGTVRVKGYAVPPGAEGRTIRQVEVSGDGGATWTTARLTSEPTPYCWQHWAADLPLKSGTRTLVVRATDSSGQNQPQKVDWNLKGYMFNAWHRATVKVR